MNSFRRLFKDLRAEVRASKHTECFQDARRRHTALARHHTIASVLGILADDGKKPYAEKEALTRTLIAEQQVSPSSFWASVLLVAYYPMLSRLRHRIWGDTIPAEDLDQLVVTCFLAVVSDYPADGRLDRTALRLRQRTERRVLGVVRREQDERQQATPVEPETFEELEVERWPEVRDESPRGPRNAMEAADVVSLLVERTGDMLDGETFDLVTATIVCGKRIPVFLERLLPDLPSDEKNRVYQRVKRRHSRALKRIRPVLEHLRCPCKDQEGLCANRYPELQEDIER
ncbi:MAG: hypothetical protein M0R76_00395 [Proteobacteria bacterium]|nr:hypothetical protein [Pseudomonadota bacterium]